MDASKPGPTSEQVAIWLLDPQLAMLPPFLNVDEVAAFLRVPKQSVYAWSSQGRLDSCKRRMGKHVRFERHQFLYLVFTEGLNGIE